MKQPDSARSQKHEAGRRRVPPELLACFDELVIDFRFASLKHYGAQFISYEIIADLILMGWTPPTEVGQKIAGEKV